MSQTKQHKRPAVKHPRLPSRQQMNEVIKTLEPCEFDHINFVELFQRSYDNVREDRDYIKLDNLNLNQLDILLPRLEKAVRDMDNIILNSDEDLPEEPLEGLKAYLEEAKVRESELRMEQINSFQKNARNQMNRVIRKDKNTVFNIAKNDAEKRVLDIFKLSDQEVAELFSDEEDLSHCAGPVIPDKMMTSWPFIIKGRENNIVPLSPGIKVPRKFDDKTQTYKDYNFMVSSFLRDNKFISKLNEHYSRLSLELSVTQDAKFKNKWWFKLMVNDPENKIRFPHDYSSLDFGSVTMGSSFGQ